MRHLYILFIYASKYFLIDHHCKRYVRIYDLLAKGKIYWCSRSVCEQALVGLEIKTYCAVRSGRFSTDWAMQAWLLWIIIEVTDFSVYVILNIANIM